VVLADCEFDDASARLGLPAKLGSQALAQDAVETFPGTIQAPLPRIYLLETVWKVSGTYQRPYHQTDHGRVDERLRAGAKPFIILAHPPVLA
jgi:hypothetical protein